MKKRMMSLFLALCLCLSLLPAAVLADGGTDSHTNHCVCGATHTEVGDHTSEEIFTGGWTPVTDTLPTASGYYYLTQNVTISSQWSIGSGVNIVLCLNGKTLTADNRTVDNTIHVISEGTLTITDCTGAGKVTGINTNDGLKYIHALRVFGTLKLYNGTITGINTGSSYGGGVTVDNNGTFYMYGGFITGNRAAGGGGVFINGGTFYLYGGTISGNTATNEGADVHNYNGSAMYANGGTVEGAVYNEPSSDGLTSGIGTENGYTGTTFNGTVTNKAEIAGGTYNGTVTNKAGSLVSGSVTNNGMFVFENGSKKSATITGTGYIQKDSGELTDNSGNALTGTVTVSTASALASAVKASDVSTIVLGGSFALDNTLEIPSGRTITLDLNGKTVSMTESTANASSFAIKNYGDLTIKDSGTDGKLTFKSTVAGISGASIPSYSKSTIGNAGTLTVENGTIKNETPYVAGYARYVIDTLNYSTLGNTEINIKGGELMGSGTAAIRQIPWSTTLNNTLNISGGSITGGYAAVVTHGFVVDGSMATVNITGGTLTGDTCSYYIDYDYYNDSQLYDGTKTSVHISNGTFYGLVGIFNNIAGSNEKPFASVSVTGGTFDSRNDYNNDIYVYTTISGDDLSYIPALTGGTYAHEPYSEYVADGYVARQNPDGTYDVVAESASSTGDELAWLLPVLGALDKEPFDDVKTGDWFYDDVQYAYETGLMTGTASRTFSPDAPVTRGMVMTILARREGIMTDRYSPWYAAGVEWAVANGISDGTNPEAEITREELATMLYRYAQLKGYDVSVGADTNILSFLDALEISDYAFEPLQWAVGSGLINGAAGVNAGKLLPQSTATRAQLAAILHRFFG